MSCLIKKQLLLTLSEYESELAKYVAMPVVTNYGDFAKAYEMQRSNSPKRKPRTPSPMNNYRMLPSDVPTSEPNEFKVSSWGSDDKNKRIVREKMAEGGVYLSSDWGKKGVSTRRLNALKRIKVGDIMHLPMYTQGYEYVGKVLKEMIPISHDNIKLRFTEISKATWGEGGPAENETLYVFEVEWVKVLFTEKDLKHLVKNGGRCEFQQGTIIKMKKE